MTKIPLKQQADIVEYVRQSMESNFKPNSTQYRELMTRVYESLSTFEMPDTWDVLTRFKVNKAHEIVNKVTPRIFAKSPKFIVSPRTDAFYEDEWDLIWEDKNKIIKRNQKFSLAVQDYLTVLFEDEDLQESLKLWAKNQVVYWNSYAQVIPKIEISRSKWKDNKVTEKLVWFKPTIDNISWTEMYYDPRYKKLKDMPWYVRFRDWVRFQDLFFLKNEKWEPAYFNLDKLQEVTNLNYEDSDTYKNQIYWITGVSDIKADKWIDKNNLSVYEFEGKLSLTWDPKDEKLYKATIVNYCLLIWLEEITQYSIVDIKAHEDVELFFSTWFVAPILGLQDEINFQKNAYATSISKQLNRSWYWSPDSWVDPSQLIWDKPWNIIVCADWVENAERNLKEIQSVPLPSQYFANMNDYNRDINNLTHTTDVSWQSWQTSQINTATGARIAFFESNSVIWEVRKNFERWAKELAYKLLQWTVDNIEENIVIKKIDETWFLEINKEALKDAINRYEIRIEAWSSSFDESEDRRNEAIAVKNIIIEAINAWANIDANKWFKQILRTFEWVNVDELFMEEEDDIMSLLWQWQSVWWETSNTGQLQPNTPASITEEVAKWSITQWL